MISCRDSPTPIHRSRMDVWDRYIRSTSDVKHRYQSIEETNSNNGLDSIINKELYSSSKENYKNLMASALSVNYKHKSWFPMWPVRQRANPHIRSPVVILDLPNIRNDLYSNLVDWSYSNYLTVAFPRSVYLWHEPTNNTLRFPLINPSCIKWNPEGSELFTATRSGSLKLYDVAVQAQLTATIQPTCHTTCFMICSTFHPSMRLLFMGCTKGSVSAFHVNKGIHPLVHIQDFHSAITTLSFSCDGNYFAVSTLSGVMGVYSIMNHQPLLMVKLGGPIRAMAWHPWKQSCLVVADCLGCMFLYNVHSSVTGKPEASYNSNYNSAILSLTFNPYSAELVMSQRIFSDDSTTPEAETQLSVLASFERVVDRMMGHKGRVPYLNWSPDGTKLASSGTDETARIWNFLPSENKKPTTKRKNLNYISSSIELGNRLGFVLR